MSQITDAGKQAVADIAERDGVSVGAVMTLLHALQQGHGNAAQFNHAELGGMGQWSHGGMTQVGDMFNDGLKWKVNAICTELAQLLNDRAVFDEGNPPQDYNPDGSARPEHGADGPGRWWPGNLGSPSATGGQNDMDYAVFPDARRLAVRRGSEVKLYDTGDHRIGGAAQQQGASRSLRFTSQHGPVGVEELQEVR